MVGLIPPAVCSDGGEGSWEERPGCRDSPHPHGCKKMTQIKSPWAVPLLLTSASRNGSKIKAGLSPSVDPPQPSHFFPTLQMCQIKKKTKQKTKKGK